MAANSTPNALQPASQPSPASSNDGGALRLPPCHPLDYPQRSLQEGFTTADTPETIMLGQQETVVRPEPLLFDIQPGVSDPEHERRHAATSSYLADPPTATRIPGGLVDTSSFVICPTRAQHLYESVRNHHSLGRWGYTLHEEDWTIEVETKAIPERGERVVVLGCQTNDNYSHWLLESVARALLFKPLDDGSWLFLTPPLNQWQRETLELIGLPKERILEVEPSGLVRFQEVIAVSRAMMEVQTFIPAAVEAVAELASSAAASSAAIDNHPRLYISRGHARYRHMANELEVFPVLADHGFLPIHPEDLSFAEQIKLLAGAEAVIGLNGTGLTNITFSAPGTTIIELHGEGYPPPPLAVLRTLAAIRGQPFAQVICPLGPCRDNRMVQQRNIAVEPQHLDELLSRLLPQ